MGFDIDENGSFVRHATTSPATSAASLPPESVHLGTPAPLMLWVDAGSQPRGDPGTARASQMRPRHARQTARPSSLDSGDSQPSSDDEKAKPSSTAHRQRPSTAPGKRTQKAKTSYFDSVDTGTLDRDGDLELSASRTRRSQQVKSSHFDSYGFVAVDHHDETRQTTARAQKSSNQPGPCRHSLLDSSPVKTTPHGTFPPSPTREPRGRRPLQPKNDDEGMTDDSDGSPSPRAKASGPPGRSKRRLSDSSAPQDFPNKKSTLNLSSEEPSSAKPAKHGFQAADSDADELSPPLQQEKTAHVKKKKRTWSFLSSAPSFNDALDESPPQQKLSLAMRGASVLAKDPAAQVKKTDCRTRATAKPTAKISALELQDDEDCRDKKNPFDNANIPHSRGPSPAAPKPKSKTDLKKQSKAKPPRPKPPKPAPPPKKPASKTRRKAKPTLAAGEESVSASDSNEGHATGTYMLDDESTLVPADKSSESASRQSADLPLVSPQNPAPPSTQDVISISSSSSKYDTEDIDMNDDAADDEDYVEKAPRSKAAQTTAQPRHTRNVGTRLRDRKTAQSKTKGRVQPEEKQDRDDYKVQSKKKLEEATQVSSVDPSPVAVKEVAKNKNGKVAAASPSTSNPPMNTRDDHRNFAVAEDASGETSDNEHAPVTAAPQAKHTQTVRATRHDLQAERTKQEWHDSKALIPTGNSMKKQGNTKQPTDGPAKRGQTQRHQPVTDAEAAKKRKPNVVPFGPDGRKTSGRSRNTAASTIESSSSGTGPQPTESTNAGSSVKKSVASKQTDAYTSKQKQSINAVKIEADPIMALPPTQRPQAPRTSECNRRKEGSDSAIDFPTSSVKIKTKTPQSRVLDTQTDTEARRPLAIPEEDEDIVELLQDPDFDQPVQDEAGAAAEAREHYTQAITNARRGGDTDGQDHASVDQVASDEASAFFIPDSLEQIDYAEEPVSAAQLMDAAAVADLLQKTQEDGCVSPKRNLRDQKTEAQEARVTSNANSKRRSSREEPEATQVPSNPQPILKSLSQPVVGFKDHQTPAHSHPAKADVQRAPKRAKLDSPPTEVSRVLSVASSGDRFFLPPNGPSSDDVFAPARVREPPPQEREPVYAPAELREQRAPDPALVQRLRGFGAQNEHPRRDLPPVMRPRDEASTNSQLYAHQHPVGVSRRLDGDIAARALPAIGPVKAGDTLHSGMFGSWYGNSGAPHRQTDAEARKQSLSRDHDNEDNKTLGGIMHRIVQVSALCWLLLSGMELTYDQGALRELKAREDPMSEVTENYRVEGGKIVRSIEKAHAEERQQLIQQHEQRRLNYIGVCEDARSHVESIATRLRSIDLDNA